MTEPSVDNPKTLNVSFSIRDNIGDPVQYAKEYAEERAIKTGNKVILDCEVIDSKGKPVKNFTLEATPKPRDTDIKKTADEIPQPTRPPPNARTSASAAELSRDNTGNADAADEGDGKASPGLPKDELVKFLNNAPRVLGGVVPSLEGIMMTIPQAALGKFTSLLPPAFKSLLPVGAIAGLVSKGPVALSGLTNLVAGAALGQVAGQALRSLTGGPAAVSGLTGALGAQAIARVTGSRAIPVNIASTFGNALLSNVAGNVAGNVAKNVLGSTPATAGVIANVVGVVTNVALNKQSGIPVNSQILGLAANVALRSAGVPTSIPTSVLGLSASSAMNPLAALIGGSVSGRIPIVPGNLSLPNLGALSGLSQNLSPGLAERLIPPNQLTSLLPGNLQAQIPRVPPRVSSGSPYTQNTVQSRRDASPEESGPVETNPNATRKDAVAKGAGGGNPKYEMKISDNYTLSDFCITPTQSPHRELRPYGKFSIDQLIENLSWLAVNIVEPIKAQFPGFTINSGYDFPGAVAGSNRKGGSKHFEGSAIDLQWRGSMRDYRANEARALWIVKNLPIRGCLLEATSRGAGIWIHVDGQKTKQAQYYCSFKDHKPISVSKFVDPLV